MYISLCVDIEQLSLIFDFFCSEGSIAWLVSTCRGIIYESIKQIILDKVLSNTKGEGSSFDLMLSRSRARKFAASGIASF